MTNPEPNACPDEEAESADLSKPAQYPSTVEGWREFSRTIEIHSTPTKGAEDFDCTINPDARVNPLAQIRFLLERFPEAFLAASQSDLTPAEWRLLRYINKTSLAQLGQPDFDPRAAMRDACFNSQWLHDMPGAFVGSEQRASDIADGMDLSIAALPIDQAKAVWAVLAFTWAIPLAKNEVLQLPWWNYQWLVAFVGHARAAA
jgi:hypothetical protein